MHKMYKLLILDDTAKCGEHREFLDSYKGYSEIEECFPGVFEITVCEVMLCGGDTVCGWKLLEQKWDVILLDFTFDPPDESDGPRALRDKIRNPGEANNETWVIGCSSTWRRSVFKVSPECIVGKTDANLNAISEKAEELRERLQEFLTRHGG